MPVLSPRGQRFTFRYPIQINALRRDLNLAVVNVRLRKQVLINRNRLPERACQAVEDQDLVV